MFTPIAHYNPSCLCIRSYCNRFVEVIASYGETKLEARRRREGQNVGKGNTNKLICTD